MKKFRQIPVIAFLAAMVLISCEKEIEEKPTAPILTKKEMLVQKTWQVHEVLRNISGQNSHYIRGEMNTTGTDYDKIRLTFKADGTGTYTDDTETVYSTTWEFTSSDERKMLLRTVSPIVMSYTWNLVEISENSFSNTTAVGDYLLVAARYIPVP